MIDEANEKRLFRAMLRGEGADSRVWLDWRARKLAATEALLSAGPVELQDLANPPESALVELERRCDSINMALYAAPPLDEDATRPALRTLAARMGLTIAERHRSAGEQGIVALRVSDAPGQKGYIPYSTRPMNWHTDGYYNGPQDRIRAFVLHCVRAAAGGGENQFLDPELALLRLFDRDPALVRALTAPDAMTIPENREPDGSIRPASVGPVLFLDERTGRPVMRYTARTRSVQWADRPEVGEARAALSEILTGEEEGVTTLRLGPGMGVINNNVLHNRTGFDDGSRHAEPGPVGGAGAARGRLVFRVRFSNRVGMRGSEWDSGPGGG